MNAEKNLNSIVIRDATSSDISQMKELIFTHGPNPWNFLPPDDVNSHLDGISSGETLGVLAFNESELVGMVTYTEHNPFIRYEPAGVSTNESAYIAEAVVSKSVAGRGLGSQLLKQACENLRAKGKLRIYVDRHEENLASAGMMNKAGFLEIDTYEDLRKRSTGTRRTTVCRYDL